MGSLTYVGSRPARYQYGDQVLATIYTDTRDWEKDILKGRYKEGQQVRGIILQAVNNDKHMLDQGRVQIRLANHDRLWVQADEVVLTAGQIKHPEATYATGIVWKCGTCMAKGWGATQREAEESFHAHQLRGS